MIRRVHFDIIITSIARSGIMAAMIARRRIAPFFIGCALLLAGASAKAATTQSAAGGASSPGSNHAQVVARLREAVLGDDPAASIAAARTLEGMGLNVRRQLIDTLRQALARDKGSVERAFAHIGDPAKIQASQTDLAAARVEARANVLLLEKGETLLKAHALYDRLHELRGALDETYAGRCDVLDAMSRREPLLDLWRQIMPADTAFNAASEKQLVVKAERVLGGPLTEALAAPQLLADAKAGSPKDATADPLAFYRVCRRIERYNAALEAEILDAQERENLRLVNDYRECLGMLPYELDARLVQSARRHSREMVELGYFAHVSPTAELKTHVQRMRAAGFDGAYGENIAAGSTQGDRTFWQWFDSPGHHKNMAAAGVSAFGVGRWQNTWTQNTGNAPRQMLMLEADRKAIVIKGEIIAPDAPPRGNR